jgi:putative restriction endonuclease
MKPGQRPWTREELILAISLCCKLPFERLHSRNPEVVGLAALIGRTPSSVALKLVNFASLDLSQQARGIKGAANTSKLDREIWNEFFSHWDSLPYESEKLLAQRKQVSIEELSQIPEEALPQAGKTREQVVKVRVNQAFSGARCWRPTTTAAASRASPSRPCSSRAISALGA